MRRESILEVVEWMRKLPRSDAKVSVSEAADYLAEQLERMANRPDLRIVEDGTDIVQVALDTIVEARSKGAPFDTIAIHPNNVGSDTIRRLWDGTFGRVRILVDTACKEGKVFVGRYLEFARETDAPQAG
jgi:hypothetical protein